MALISNELTNSAYVFFENHNRPRSFRVVLTKSVDGGLNDEDGVKKRILSRITASIERASGKTQNGFGLAFVGFVDVDNMAGM